MSNLTKTLYMTRGLPGSGKSTWAKNKVLDALNHEIVIVNKDDIRKEFAANGWVWSRENEKQVVIERNVRIVRALREGKSVISSDTNFGKKHENVLRGIAQGYKADFVVIDFTNVPIATCIEQDAKRVAGKVGEEVIRRMAAENGIVEPVVPYVPAGGPLAIICDLDGTLALSKGIRNIYDYAKCAKDLVNKPVFDIIRMFHADGTDIIYLSGREDWCRDQTDDFLRENNCPKGPLFMRASGDHRNDAIVKRELFDKHVRNVYNVRFVLDDRDRVVKMWRELGLTCLQVAEGNF